MRQRSDIQRTGCTDIKAFIEWVTPLNALSLNNPPLRTNLQPWAVKFKSEPDEQMRHTGFPGSPMKRLVMDAEQLGEPLEGVNRG
jgi:hypothetical protein